MKENCIECNISRKEEKFVANRNICRKCQNSYMKKYRKKTSREYDKKYYQENEEYYQNYRLQNKDKQQKYDKEYYKINKNDKMKKVIKYEIKRKKEDQVFRILKNTRSRIRACINVKKDKTNKIIQCSPEFYRQWLEYQFDAWMSWDNYGKYWEIDHVKPCSVFDLSNKDQFKKCFIWKNTRPLEKSKNSSKNNKYNDKIQHLHNITIKAFLNKVKRLEMKQNLKGLS